MIISSGWLPVALLSLAGAAPPMPQAPPNDTMIGAVGARLHFRTWAGRGDVTIVFQAGGGADLSAWASVPSRIARRSGARVVAYDRAGLGRSETGPIDLSPDVELDQLDRGLDVLGVGRIILVGHSYGGLLSLVHAARRPDRVVGLVLVDPMNGIFIARMGLPWLRHTVPEVTDPRTARDTVVYRMQRTIGALFEQGRAAESAIRVPAIVITAGIPWWDSALARQAWRQSHEELARRATPGELVVAKRSRHDVPESEPDVISAALERMLRRVDGAHR